MSASPIRAISILALSACMLPAVSTPANELDIDYAEHMPLAAESLLLDITRDGDRWVAVGERGHVVYSANGSEWVQAETVPTRSALTTVIAQGTRLWAAGHDSVILTSGDKGVTWTRKYFDAERQQPIMDMHFLDDSRGMAIGAYGLMLVTTDGGETWEDQAVGDEEWHLNAMLDLGDGRLMIAGEAGFSYRSSDNGETWETLEMPYPGSMFSIVASGEGCITVFGLRGHAQETCDFGDSWVELDTGTEMTLSGAAHVDGRTVFVGNGGAVMEWNGGEEFSLVTHSSGVDFSSVIHVPGSSFMLVGEEGIHNYPETGAEGGNDD